MDTRPFASSTEPRLLNPAYLEGFDRQPDGRQRVEFSRFAEVSASRMLCMHAMRCDHGRHAAPRPVTPRAAVQRKKGHEHLTR